MSGNRDVIDLCSTCVNKQNCIFKIYSGKPVWYCNEFDVTENSIPSRKENNGKEKRNIPDQRILSSQEEDEPEGLKGLCVNCDERRVCLRPKPEGGIWHCEEYS